MLHYRNKLSIIKTVDADHKFVLAESGYPIIRHPFNFFIDEVNKPDFDMSKSFYRKHFGQAGIEDRMKMCQAKITDTSLVEGSLISSIDVMINDVGKFVILDGNHRACVQLSQRGGLIRMNVRYISPNWQRIVDLVELTRDGKGYTYSKIEHPFFFDIPYYRDESRAGVICEVLNKVTCGNRFVYDIGCNTGILSRYFATHGFTSFGFDISSGNIAICEALSRSMNYFGLYFVEPDVLTMLKNHLDRMILAINCLSVIHHFARAGNYELFVNWIREMARVALIVFIDSESEKNSSYYKDQLPGCEYLEDVFTNNSLKYKKIYTCDLGRTIYAVSRYIDL